MYRDEAYGERAEDAAARAEAERKVAEARAAVAAARPAKGNAPDHAPEGDTGEAREGRAPPEESYSKKRAAELFRKDGNGSASADQKR